MGGITPIRTPELLTQKNPTSRGRGEVAQSAQRETASSLQVVIPEQPQDQGKLPSVAEKRPPIEDVSAKVKLAAEIKEGQEDGGLLGAFGGAFIGAAKVLTHDKNPITEYGKTGLFGIIGTITAAAFLVIGWASKGTGALLKNTFNEYKGVVDSAKSGRGYEAAEAKHKTAENRRALLEQQIRELRQQVETANFALKAKKEVLEKTEDKSTPQYLDAVKDYERLAEDFRGLQDRLEKLGKRRKKAVEKEDKAEKQLGKAKENIPKEAERIRNRAEKAAQRELDI